MLKTTSTVRYNFRLCFTSVIAKYSAKTEHVLKLTEVAGLVPVRFGSRITTKTGLEVDTAQKDRFIGQ